MTANTLHATTPATHSPEAASAPSCPPAGGSIASTPVRAPRPAPYSGTAATLTCTERTRAAHAMKTLGGFASAIAEAYFTADSGNEARLIRAFPELFLKAHELNRLDAWRHSNRV